MDPCLISNNAIMVPEKPKMPVTLLHKRSGGWGVLLGRFGKQIPIVTAGSLALSLMVTRT